MAAKGKSMKNNPLEIGRLYFLGVLLRRTVIMTTPFR